MNRNWKQSLFVLPGVSLSILPKFICPVCWPAYAGLLSSLGLGFLVSTEYLLPLTAVFLTVALATLAFRANKRHGYGPFWLGLVAAIAILLSKFVWDSMPTSYGAVGLLILASVWNAWPRPSTPSHAVRIHVQSSQVK